MLRHLSWATTDFVRRRMLRAVAEAEASLASLDDPALRRRSLSLRYRLQSGEDEASLLPEAFAIARAACQRTLGLRHYDVQLLGGWAMCRRAIVEMQTGEGKTLTAVLPAYVAALAGEGVHVATANDYLAVRDARYLRPAYELLGLTVGEIDSTTPRCQRAEAYRCDIIYSTARELGFDFLRDRLLGNQSGESRSDFWSRLTGEATQSVPRLQRGLEFALVDEADSLLIDEARTPLIIASDRGPAEVTRAAYRWAAGICGRLAVGDDFECGSDQLGVQLTGAGRRRVRELIPAGELDSLPLYELYEFVERALRAARDFQRDRQYIVRDGEIVIVDEFTGRLASGRKWRDGLHQAVEAKEGLSISVATGELARVSVQNYFRQYRRLAGMTGTAWSARREFSRIYGLDVIPVPTQRPCRREHWDDRVLATNESRWEAVVAEVVRLHQTGRPVLIGTRSIDKSEQLAQKLRREGLDVELLNARQPAREAEIVAQAGQRGRITVATNMAGRGTDILLGPGVAELGGLHVIGTELHESARIDRQLSGRCARQGDPGSFRQFMALDDDILEAGCGAALARLVRRAAARSRQPSTHWATVLRQAQARVERDHYRQRRWLLYAERDTLERQRELGLDPYLDGGF